jgi:hypothetical protein
MTIYKQDFEFEPFLTKYAGTCYACFTGGFGVNQHRGVGSPNCHANLWFNARQAQGFGRWAVVSQAPISPPGALQSHTTAHPAPSAPPPSTTDAAAFAQAVDQAVKESLKSWKEENTERTTQTAIMQEELTKLRKICADTEEKNAKKKEVVQAEVPSDMNTTNINDFIQKMVAKSQHDDKIKNKTEARNKKGKQGRPTKEAARKKTAEKEAIKPNKRSQDVNDGTPSMAGAAAVPSSAMRRLITATVGIPNAAVEAFCKRHRAAAAKKLRESAAAEAAEMAALNSSQIPINLTDNSGDTSSDDDEQVENCKTVGGTQTSESDNDTSSNDDETDEEVETLHDDNNDNTDLTPEEINAREKNDFFYKKDKAATKKTAAKNPSLPTRTRKEWYATTKPPIDCYKGFTNTV